MASCQYFWLSRRFTSLRRCQLLRVPFNAAILRMKSADRTERALPSIMKESASAHRLPNERIGLRRTA